MGLNPARDILSPAYIDALVEQTLAHGGLISYKQNSDGTQSPYEMNVNYIDALSDPNGNEALDVQIDRFMAAQAIMLSLIGMPGIYFHSLFGSRNWREGVEVTKHNRTINRQKLGFAELEKQLLDSNSLRSKVFTRYCQLLLARSSSSAFDPHGSQKILNVGKGIFAVLRTSPDKSRQTLCLQNVTAKELQIQNPLKKATRGLLTSRLRESTLTLKPYKTLWID